MSADLPNSAERGSGRKTIWVFTPSHTDPKDLDFILVQRHQLLQDAVERVRESALTDHKHHLLFVGPRGCGKTHLVTLIVSRLSEDDALTDRLRIAWLNEDETCTTLLDLLLKIHAALEKRYPAEYRADMIGAAFEMKQDAAQEFIAQHLLASLGSRTLLVVAENLDAIFEGLGDAGQKQLRAFIQENPKLSIVATAQRLVEDLSKRTSPFFGFFQTEHLKPLNVEEATQLLQNIARLNQQDSVVEFLATSRGISRVRALHHLSGGNHRIYIVLSQFITRDTIDALLGPFMKMVDELTPYYQERVRWLPTLQRKIVEYLCSCEGTVPVKAIAKRLFATPQTISSQLQDLREKGYVEANQRGRESLYEISEPLMRICVEVKENQRRQPLRLLVDFLRVWYDDAELSQRLGKMEPASASRAYLESAIERNRTEGNLRKQLLMEDLRLSLPVNMSPTEREELLQECEDCPEAVAVAAKNWAEGNRSEAIRGLDETISLETNASDRAALFYFRGRFYLACGDTAKAIDDFTALIGISNVPIKQMSGALVNRGFAYGKMGMLQRAIEDYTAVLGFPGVPKDVATMALVNRGCLYGLVGELQRAIDDCTAVIGLLSASVEQVAQALVTRGYAYAKAGDSQRAIADYTEVIDLSGAPVQQVALARFARGFTRGQAGDSRAIDDYTEVITLGDVSAVNAALALFARALARDEAGQEELAIADYSNVIGLSGAPVGLVALALFTRGLIAIRSNRKQDAKNDFEAVTRLENAPVETAVDAYLALSALHLCEGRWNEGFEALDAGLGRGAEPQPSHLGTASNLVGAVFSAGLSPDARRARVGDLLRIYRKHEALPVLGEGVVKHIGGVFRAGEPYPSADNLEQWASAWEQAAASVDEFRLSVRLLRTGVDFVKAGGKDPGILLDLTSAEREILKQSLGLSGTDQDRADVIVRK